MHRFAVAFVACLVAISAAHAAPTYKKVEGSWRGSSLCQAALDVEFEGTDKGGTLRWREGPTGPWSVVSVPEVAPVFNRFMVGSADNTTSVQGAIDGGRIEGSVTFYQRACDYRFVLQRS